MIYEYFFEALIWSYYFSYKCIQNWNVQHMAISYNNSSFFSNLFKAIFLNFFCIKHIIFCKKNLCMIFFFGVFLFFSLKFGVMENLVEFYKKIKKLHLYYKKNTIWKEFLMNINETYLCMKRKPIYPPTNNITINVHQKSSKIDFIVFRISSYLISFLARVNCYYEQRKCN